MAAGHLAQRRWANLNDMPCRLLLKVFKNRFTAPLLVDVALHQVFKARAVVHRVPLFLIHLFGVEETVGQREGFLCPHRSRMNQTLGVRLGDGD